MINWTWYSVVYEIAGEQRKAEERKRNAQPAEEKNKQKYCPAPRRRTHHKASYPFNSPLHDNMGQQSTLVGLRRGMLKGQCTVK